MKFVAIFALFVLSPMAARAVQKPSTPPAQQALSEVDRKAETYADFILGRIGQSRFEDTGNQEYADQAIDYYKKAEALNPQVVAISLALAETYAESQRISDAVLAARAIVKAHPENLAAHRLLAGIYLRSLGQLSPNANQDHVVALAVEQYQAVLRLDPTDTAAGLSLARLYGFQNQPQKAVQVLEQILDRDPTSERALAQYTELLLDQGQGDKAVARISKAAGEQGSARLYDLLGDTYAQMHEEADAVQAYRQATRIEPDVPDHWQRLARTLLDADQYSEAAAAYEQLVKLDPNNPHDFVRLAECYFELKQYTLAEAKIQLAKRLAPTDPDVNYNEALIAQAQGRYADAISAVSSAIASLKHQSPDPTASPEAYGTLYRELGRLYRQQGNYPAALDAFHQLMALGPKQEHEGRLDLIETYRDSNQLGQAISTAKEALAANPQDAQLKVTYALLLSDNQQTDEAVKTLRGMLAGTPADREIYLEIAQVEQRGRHYADAEKDARMAESMSQQPSDKATAWFMLGAIYEQQKKYSQAEPFFQKALQVTPDNAEVLNDYGYMLAEEGIRLDQAAEMVKRALSQDANSSAYLDSLGWTYFKKNQFADAQKYLLKAVTRSPHDPTILGHLADVYNSMGETNQAIATWEKALVEWHRAMPADYEPDRVREVEKDLARAKSQLARKNHSTAGEPH